MTVLRLNWLGYGSEAGSERTVEKEYDAVPGSEVTTYELDVLRKNSFAFSSKAELEGQYKNWLENLKRFINLNEYDGVEITGGSQGGIRSTSFLVWSIEKYKELKAKQQRTTSEEKDFSFLKLLLSKINIFAFAAPADKISASRFQVKDFTTFIKVLIKDFVSAIWNFLAKWFIAPAICVFSKRSYAEIVDGLVIQNLSLSNNLIKINEFYKAKPFPGKSNILYVDIHGVKDDHLQAERVIKGMDKHLRLKNRLSIIGVEDNHYSPQRFVLNTSQPLGQIFQNQEVQNKIKNGKLHMESVETLKPLW